VAGSSIIHGVALRKPDFEKMAAAGVGLIWSPRSNIELHGETAVATAKAVEVKEDQRITIALAPDWSPSGSDGVLQEFKNAAVWSAGQGDGFTKGSGHETSTDTTGINKSPGHRRERGEGGCFYNLTISYAPLLRSRWNRA
jgi:hypothetical protein